MICPGITEKNQALHENEKQGSEVDREGVETVPAAGETGILRNDIYKSTIAGERKKARGEA